MTSIAMAVQCASDGESATPIESKETGMMTDMMGWMMGGMGLVWILVIIVLVLGAAAIVKYLKK